MRNKRSKYNNSSKFNGRNAGNRRSFNKRKIKVWEVSELMRVVERDGVKNTEGSLSNVSTEETSNSFEDFGVSKQILTNIKARGYTKPTPIQDKAIPVITSGKDLIGNANTGTGKTSAFLIPLIDKVFKNKNEKVLIITPTRELAVQIYDEFRSLSTGMGIYTATCIGGANMRKQISELRKTPNFVIGTPGRLKDLIKHNFLNLSKFNNVVLDEADLMVDIGFVTEIKYFISLLPQKRQSFFFSATFPAKVEDIIRSFVKNPVKINVKNRDTAENVEQIVVRTNGQKKIEVLDRTLKQSGFDKVLIFGRTKHGVQDLSNELISRGFKAGAIHGNKRQSQRLQILNKFKKNEIDILLATDVASRGLDIDNVSHVINYDMPESYENYIHRIGRTGRADKKGSALTFVEC
ncbi:MAG: DEAD/DEAH box helicase [Patescibacteria group bacterium]